MAMFARNGGYFLEEPKFSVCDGGKWTRFSHVSCMLEILSPILYCLPALLL